MQTDKYSELLNRLENEELEVSVMGQTQCICPDMITHLLSIFFCTEYRPRRRILSAVVGNLPLSN